MVGDDGDACTRDWCDPATGECRKEDTCHPPRVISFPGEQAVVGEEYFYDVEAEDPDAHTLIYFLETFPIGMTIEPESGFIRWVPALSDVDYHTITILVEGQTGQTDVQTYTLPIIETELIFRRHVYQGIPPDIGQVVKLRSQFAHKWQMKDSWPQGLIAP